MSPGFVLTLIQCYVRQEKLGRVLYDPFQMKLGSRSSRAPDVLVVSNARKSAIKRTYLDGPADLVVEVVRPDEPKRDYVKKYQEYERAGVREYWIIDPQQRSCQFHELRDDGKFRAAEIGIDSIYRSKVLPGVWLQIDWLWPESQPTPSYVLQQWTTPA
jgi:Uma2 family endonuclease